MSIIDKIELYLKVKARPLTRRRICDKLNVPFSMSKLYLQMLVEKGTVGFEENDNPRGYQWLYFYKF